jgi:hypothetical protein
LKGFEMSKKKSAHEWFEIIQECRASGLTDHQWCKENGIPVGAFYYQAKKLRDTACELPEPSRTTVTASVQEVVELCSTQENTVLTHPVPALPEVLPPAITLTIDGVCIAIQNHATPLLVSTIMQAITAKC